jgi:hypothetical protein
MSLYELHRVQRFLSCARNSQLESLAKHSAAQKSQHAALPKRRFFALLA